MSDKLFAAIDSLEDPESVLLVLKRDALYRYLLHSLQRGIVFRNIFRKLLSSLMDSDGDMTKLATVGFLAVALNPDDKELLSVVEEVLDGDYETLEVALGHNVEDIVAECNNGWYMYQILVLLCITSKDVFTRVLEELIKTIDFGVMFNEICRPSDEPYIKCDGEIQMAVIRAYYGSLGQCDMTSPELRRESAKRIRFLIDNEDNV